MRFVVLFLLFFFAALFQPVCAIQVNYIDTNSLEVKQFDNQKIEAYKSDGAFNYNTAPVKEEGLFSLIAYYVVRLLYELFNVKAGDISLYDILVYALMFFAAVIILLQLFRTQISGFFSREPVQLINYKTDTENIFETNFEKLIEDAVCKKDFRLATRLFYLKTLKILTEAGCINWQKNKTNFEYYYELKGNNIRKNFYELTVVFESTWYGNHEVTESIFTEYSQAFNGFLNQLRK